MSAAEGLRRIVHALRVCGIDYMLAGSHASGLHGIPRATQDFDIVIDPQEEALRRLVANLVADEFYADEAAALDALRRRAMFNVVDEVTGWKTDFVVLPRDAFSRAQWGRRQAASVLGVEVVAATSEDTVLAKLVWARRGGGSERQLRDVAGVVAVQGAALDRVYIDSWLARLGVADLWRKATENLPSV